MLSRVAETIYWMGRYVERAESTARMLQVESYLRMDLPAAGHADWGLLLSITGSEANFFERFEAAEEGAVLSFLLADPDTPSSVTASLRMARENARMIRDIIPREAWEQLNNLYHFAREQVDEGLGKRGRNEYLRRIVVGSQTLTGMLAGTMNHDDGYAFLRCGRNLERADMTTRIVDVRAETLTETNDQDGVRRFENIQWMSVLKSLTGYQMYRRSMQVRINRPDVLRFLLQSPEFPRAVRHCVEAVAASLTALERNETALRIIGRLQRLLDGLDVAVLDGPALHDFVDEVQIGLGELHDAIAETYFLAPIRIVD